MKKQKYTREELYDLVWKELMIHLARRFGYSDNGLRKICRQLDIPTPPIGYWARIQSGQKVKRIPLAKPKKSTPESYEFYIPDEYSTERDSINEPRSLLPPDLDVENIHVPNRIHKFHPLVKKMHGVLVKLKPDEYGVVWSWKDLTVCVAPKSLRRAMRILDTLIKKMKEYEVDSDKNGSYFLIEGEKVHFELREIVRRKDHVPTKEDDKYPYSTPRWDYFPTGKLTLHIMECAVGIRKTWSDGIKKTLEEQIGGFILGLGRHAYIVRVRRIEFEERNKRWKAERELRAAAEKRIRILKTQAQQWKECQVLYEFIQEVEIQSEGKQLSTELQSKRDEWIRWAKRYVDYLNPILEKLPFETEFNSEM